MPAAALIPAPLAYIKVVAVQKVIGGFLSRTTGSPLGCIFGQAWASAWRTCLHLTVRCGLQGFYFEGIRMFQAGIRLEYISME